MTYRQLVSSWSVVICDGNRCRLSWSNKEQAASIHQRGDVDRVGVIHWDGWDRRPDVRGIYRMLRWVALSLHRDWRLEPEWLRLYHTCTWASRELKAQFHRLALVKWSAKDRQRSWQLVHDEALDANFGLSRSDYYNYITWVNHGLSLLVQTGKRKYLRKPVEQSEIDSWREMRENGMTLEAIGNRYKRSAKVVWYHLARTS